LISQSFKNRINLVHIEVGNVYTIQNVSPSELDLLTANGLNVLNQNHSNDCITCIADLKKSADAILQKRDQKNYIVAIKTADCLPLVGWNSEYIFLAHAGWRGIFSDILSNIHNIIEQKFNLWIGPSISQNHYKVQKDFVSLWKTNPFFKECYNPMDCTFDLNKMLLLQSKEIILNYQKSEVCTFQNQAYASFRRNKTQNRNLTLYSPFELI
tara:strand:+ start:106 stop:741 length:636 start_codon:yes stop_codon:yes gene_type:complete